jgi:Holliday junction resolvasome RuvABC DNA-binding subunit
MAITGRAPNQLRFVRDGEELVDSRSADEQRSAHELRERVSRPRRASKRRADERRADERRADERTAVDRAQSATRSRFGDVVKLEHAKQALMQLGYKARAARKALEEVSAHVDANADIADLVEAVLARDRRADRMSEHDDVFALAKQALIQLGYPAAIATRAVDAARVHVDAATDAQAVIKEALRRCAHD